MPVKYQISAPARMEPATGRADSGQPIPSSIKPATSSRLCELPTMVLPSLITPNPESNEIDEPANPRTEIGKRMTADRVQQIHSDLHTKHLRFSISTTQVTCVAKIVQRVVLKLIRRSRCIRRFHRYTWCSPSPAIRGSILRSNTRHVIPLSRSDRCVIKSTQSQRPAIDPLGRKNVSIVPPGTLIAPPMDQSKQTR